MIAYLKGKIFWKGEDKIILLVHDLGYEIFVPKNFLPEIKIGQEKEFFTYEYLREEARELYGFLNHDDLRLFEKLLSVSGVGPKMALNILSLGSAKVREAISQGNVALLSSITGVGKKTAQKVILELKGALVEEVSEEGQDLYEALQSLGYSVREISEALKKANFPKEMGLEEKVRELLKLLGKK